MKIYNFTARRVEHCTITNDFMRWDYTTFKANLGKNTGKLNSERTTISTTIKVLQFHAKQCSLLEVCYKVKDKAFNHLLALNYTTLIVRSIGGLWLNV